MTMLQGLRSSRFDSKPIFALFDLVREKNESGAETNLLSLSYGRVVPRDINSADGLLPASFDGYTVVEPGDVVLRLTDMQNDQRSLRSGLVRERGIITSAYVTLRPKPGNDARFLAYAFHALDVSKALYALGGGLRQGLSFEDLKFLMLPAPDKAAQAAVADEIDRSVAVINGAITAREAEMALAGELLGSGVDHIIFPPEVRAKPHFDGHASSVVDPFTVAPPRGWSRSSLRRVLRKKAVRSGGQGRLLSVFLDRGVIPFDQAGPDRVHNPSQDLSDYQVVAAGDLVMNNQQAWRGSVGVSTLTGIVSPAYHVYEVGNMLDPTWAGYAFRSRPMVFLYEQVSRGVGSIQRNLDGGSLLSVPFLYPSRDEQEARAREAESWSDHATRAADRMRASASRLVEMRSSLIWHAVAGDALTLTDRQGASA